jgi:hypothetical protein
MLCWKERIHDSPDADTSFFGAHLAWAVPSLGLKYYLWKTQYKYGFLPRNTLPLSSDF